MLTYHSIQGPASEYLVNELYHQCEGRIHGKVYVFGGKGSWLYSWMGPNSSGFL